MEEQIKRLIKPMVIAAVVFFAGCCWIKTPATWDDYSSYMGYTTSCVTIIFVSYDLWLWRWNPFERMPILKKAYRGEIHYIYDGVPCVKEIEVEVRQTLFSVRVKTWTDTNSSTTVAGLIAQEYGDFVLYYTYVTNPDSRVQRNNPIQYGTCRMLLDEMTTIKGKYWTTSQTVGDIEWSS